MGKRSGFAARVGAVVMAAALSLGLAQAPVAGVQAASKGSVKSVTVTNLPAKQLTLKKGKTKTLKVKVTGTGNISKEVTFKSSKTKVATVSSKGKIKAKKNGTTNITITSKANKKKKVVIKLTVGTPVTKVSLSQSAVSVNTGSGASLSASVLPQKASNKKLIWSSSDETVATVSGSGVVTGVKAGTAVVTAAAQDGSGKKATCTVTVTSPAAATPTPSDVSFGVIISSVSIVNPMTVQVGLSEAQALSASDFTVKSKMIVDGAYNHTCRIAGVSTTDQKVYTITLDAASILSDRERVQVTVQNLKGTGTASKEAYYDAGTTDYQDASIVLTATKGVSVAETLYADGYGYISYTAADLPAGISCSTENGYAEFSGAPTQTGVFISSLVAKDELGNSITCTLTWVIGSDDVVAAAYAPYYTLIGNGSVYVGSYIYVSGGSGDYSYELAEGAGGFLLGSDGTIEGNVLSAGTYSADVNVSDSEGLTTTARFTVNVRQGIEVSGTVKAIDGNTIPDAIVEFSKHGSGDLYFSGSGYTLTDENGSYTAVLDAGTYDICAYYDVYGETPVYEFDRSITSDITGKDFTLSLYTVTVSGGDFGYWIDDFWNVYGYGNTMYLPAGTYSLTSETDNFLSADIAEISFTVPDTLSVEATVTTVSYIAGEILADEPVDAALSATYAYYEFTPKTTGTYYFYSGDSTSDPQGFLYDEYGDELAANDDYGDSSGLEFQFSYECEAGMTYYLGVCDYFSDSASTVLHVSETPGYEE